MPQLPLNILLIEDNDADAYTVRRALDKNFDRSCMVTEVDRMKAAEVVLLGGRERFDIILLDLGLPDTLGGRDTFERLDAVRNEVPVIILSNLDDHELAVRLVQIGASDFVRKAIMAAVPRALCDAIGFAVCRHKNMAAMQTETDRRLAQKDQVIDWMTGGYSVQKSSADNSD